MCCRKQRDPDELVSRRSRLFLTLTRTSGLSEPRSRVVALPRLVFPSHRIPRVSNSPFCRQSYWGSRLLGLWRSHFPGLWSLRPFSRAPVEEKNTGRVEPERHEALNGRGELGDGPTEDEQSCTVQFKKVQNLSGSLCSALHLSG